MTRRKRKSLFVSWGRLPPRQCPCCHVTLRSATGLGLQEHVHPKPGDLTCCDQCVTWLAFEPDLRLRLATPAEVATLDPKLRALGERLARELPGPGRPS